MTDREPVTLAPLDPEAALRALLAVDPAPSQKKSQDDEDDGPESGL